MYVLDLVTFSKITRTTKAFNVVSKSTAFTLVHNVILVGPMRDLSKEGIEFANVFGPLRN